MKNKGFWTGLTKEELERVVEMGDLERVVVRGVTYWWEGDTFHSEEHPGNPLYRPQVVEDLLILQQKGATPGKVLSRSQGRNMLSKHKYSYKFPVQELKGQSMTVTFNTEECHRILRKHGYTVPIWKIREGEEGEWYVTKEGDTWDSQLPADFVMREIIKDRLLQLL